MLSRLFVSFSLFSSFFLSFFSLADALSPELRLRKLSIHLRGVAPAYKEYLALEEAVKKQEGEKFFFEKAQEYLKTEAHLGKMINRLDQLFWLKTAQGFPETSKESWNSLDLLFKEVIAKNMSWDTLLTAKEYTLYSQGKGITSGDNFFLNPIDPEITEKEEGFFTFPISDKDLRFAGSLTTGRFFRRYGTTNINKNRRRAAAIFRIFLCDEMIALIEPTQDEEDELLRKIFPPKPTDGFHRNISTMQSTQNDIHGTQESCRACHYKLDPLGKAFITSGAALSSEPAPGALVYRREDRSLVNIAGRGIQEIATAIVAQPEYAKCQVTHFWNWFIRRDRFPSDKKLTDLVRVWNEKSRRPNDFIAYLVNQPEFYTDSTSAIPTLLDTKPLLERCDKCHAGLTSVKLPSFVAFPMGGNPEKHVRWLKRIVARLDLENEGKDRTMPPVESAWKLSEAEISLLKAWVAGGARDEAGKATISEEKAKELLKLTQTIFAKTDPSFHHSFRRYLSHHDFFRLWRDKFPGVDTSKIELDCQVLSEKNRAIVGDPNPFNGELIYRQPSSSFVKWYGQCFLAWSSAYLEERSQKGMEPLFGEVAFQLLKKEGKLEVIQQTKETEWKSLSKEVQERILLHLVHEYLGKNIMVQENDFVKNLFVLFEKEKEKKSIFEVFKKILFMLGTQDEFILY